MNYNGSFNPKYLSGTQLYFAKNTATVSSWNDQSSNGYDLSQAVALQQPTIGANSVDFDGNNDFMIRLVSNVFGSDTQGYIFFSGYYNNFTQNRILTSCDNASSFLRRFDININNTNSKFQLNIRNGGASINTVTFNTTTLTNGQYYYGWIRSDGSSYSGMLNGVSQAITTTLANDGRWWSFVTLRDNLVIGAISAATTVFGSAQVNKLYYNNTSLSASDLWKTEQFFANPLNYD
jgi:hypothetical protein